VNITSVYFKQWCVGSFQTMPKVVWQPLRQ